MEQQEEEEEEEDEEENPRGDSGKAHFFAETLRHEINRDERNYKIGSSAVFLYCRAYRSNKGWSD